MIINLKMDLNKNYEIIVLVGGEQKDLSSIAENQLTRLETKK